jgi:hypothetical protein
LRNANAILCLSDITAGKLSTGAWANNINGKQYINRINKKYFFFINAE